MHVLFVVHPQLGRRTLFHWEVEFSNVVLCVTRELVDLRTVPILERTIPGTVQLDALPREKSSPTFAYNMPQRAPTAKSPLPSASASGQKLRFNQLQSVLITIRHSNWFLHDTREFTRLGNERVWENEPLVWEDNSERVLPPPIVVLAGSPPAVAPPTRTTGRTLTSWVFTVLVFEAVNDLVLPTPSVRNERGNFFSSRPARWVCWTALRASPSAH